MFWAEDPNTSERALKRVVRTFLNESDELVHVKVNGETITCTPGHPFYVYSAGWVAAKDLNPDNKLVLQDGEYASVGAIQREKLAEPIAVYNFEVEDFHTYYVSCDSVLVHNKCGNDYSTKNTKNYSSAMKSEGEARSLARTMLGSNPIYIGDNKYRSANGRWQYRAKTGDVMDNHIHLERLNPNTGEVLYNWHLRWK